MAKVSARGAHKVTQHSIEFRDSEGYDHKFRLALRSDGRILRAHDLRSTENRENYGSRGWNRGGYSIIAKGFLRANRTADTDRFDTYAGRYFSRVQAVMPIVSVTHDTTI